MNSNQYDECQERSRTENHMNISDLAERFLDEALNAGEAFTEGLTNWSIEKARREIGEY